MKKSITQDHYEDNQVTQKMQNFLKKFHIGAALKKANAYKNKGYPIMQIFQYLFVLIFSHRSMYMDMLTNKNGAIFKKDTVYRFMQSTYINWIRFTSTIAANIIKQVEPLTSEDRVNTFIIDDSICERNRSKKVELLSKVYDHAQKVYRYGFRMLTLGWSDGNTFVPVNSVLLSSENEKSRINEPKQVDKRTAGHKRRQFSLTKATTVMLDLIKEAKKTGINASYVLFDSWFTSPSTVHAICGLGYNVISMVKKSPKMFFRYQDENLPLTKIYQLNKKRRGRSKYLLSVIVDVIKDDKVIPAKIVYVRNRNKRSEYLCLISTNIDLNEEEIIRIYGKRWIIEVFFKVCKSYLRLNKECHSLSYDAMTAHVAIVFTRYMMLAFEERINIDERSWGELFLRFSDELADITWIHAFHLLLDIFMNTLSDKLFLTSKVLDELMNAFLSAIPSVLKCKLKIS